MSKLQAHTCLSKGATKKKMSHTHLLISPGIHAAHNRCLWHGMFWPVQLASASQRLPVEQLKYLQHTQAQTPHTTQAHTQTHTHTILMKQMSLP